MNWGFQGPTAFKLALFQLIFVMQIKQVVEKFTTVRNTKRWKQKRNR